MAENLIFIHHSVFLLLLASLFFLLCGLELRNGSLQHFIVDAGEFDVARISLRADHEFDVAGVLDDLEQRLNGQGDRSIIAHSGLPLLLHELSESRGIPANRVCLPLSVRAGRLSQIELGFLILETRIEHAHTEGTHARLLRVFLLVLGQLTRQILDSRLIFHVEAEGLGLEASMVDQDTSVGLQAAERTHDVTVDLLNLADGSRILQRLNWLLLDCKDDAVGALETDGCGAAVHRFERVLYLEQLAVGSKN